MLISPWRRRVQLLRTFTPTHNTAGLPGFGAIDVFGRPGSRVIVPETCQLVWPHMIPWDRAMRVGGLTCYLQGESGDTYFLTHFGTIAQPSTYAAGESVGTVAAVPYGWWAPHIHEGKHAGRYDPPGV